MEELGGRENPARKTRLEGKRHDYYISTNFDSFIVKSMCLICYQVIGLLMARVVYRRSKLLERMVFPPPGIKSIVLTESSIDRRSMNTYASVFTKYFGVYYDETTVSSTRGSNIFRLFGDWGK
jgi:hypothetical protein